MAPLTPDWVQPSHPAIQKVLVNSEKEYTTKSISLIDLPAYGLFAKFTFPPCTWAEKPTYATVQMGKEQHLNLNSDLVYINHSCNPSVIFDTLSQSIIAGPNGLKAGEELTFFYPSTEWNMDQTFDCFCGASTCRGHISGAKNMSAEQLKGMWLNPHIRELLEEHFEKLPENGNVYSGKAKKENDLNDEMEVESGNGSKNGTAAIEQTESKDLTLEALTSNLTQARKMVEAAQKALDTYKSLHGKSSLEDITSKQGKGANRENGVGSRELSGEMGGDTTLEEISGNSRRGVTNREMSGEMGGDTVV